MTNNKIAMARFKTWLEQQREVYEIKGEYWIVPGGHIHYADGDYGDYNHELHVLEQLWSDIADFFGVHNIHHKDWTDIKKEIVEEILKDKGLEQDLIKKIIQKSEEDIDSIIVNELKQENQKELLEEFNIANGHGDAREYALKKWNWIRVANNNVETYRFTPTQAKDIAYGIGDIEPDIADDAVFTVHILSNNKLVDITYADLEKGKTSSSQDKHISSEKAVEDIEKKNLPSFYRNKPFPFSEWEK